MSIYDEQMKRPLGREADRGVESAARTPRALNAATTPLSQPTSLPNLGPKAEFNSRASLDRRAPSASQTGASQIGASPARSGPKSSGSTLPPHDGTIHLSAETTISTQVPWSGFQRVIDYPLRGGESTPSDPTARDVRQAAAEQSAQRTIEHEWATFLRGQRLQSGHPLEQLYGFDVLVSPHVARLIAGWGVANSRAREDVVRFSEDLAARSQSSVCIPLAATDALAAFTETLTRRELSKDQFAEAMGVSSELIVAGRVFGATVVRSLQCAVERVGERIDSATRLVTPILVGHPPARLTDDKLQRTLARNGVFVGVVPQIDDSLRARLNNIGSLFAAAKDFISQGGDPLLQAQLRTSFAELRDSLPK